MMFNLWEKDIGLIQMRYGVMDCSTGEMYQFLVRLGPVAVALETFWNQRPRWIWVGRQGRKYGGHSIAPSFSIRVLWVRVGFRLPS